MQGLRQFMTHYMAQHVCVCAVCVCGVPISLICRKSALDI